jgi:hypothetical protein
MPLTGPMKVTRVSGDSKSGFSLFFTPPLVSTLFLGRITIRPAAPGALPLAVSGTVSKGKGENTPPGGAAALQVGTTLYNLIATLIGPPGPPLRDFVVQVESDGTHAFDLKVTVTAPAASPPPLAAAKFALLSPASDDLAYAHAESEPPPSMDDLNDARLDEGAVAQLSSRSS